jgi:hypothetical protein
MMVLSPLLPGLDSTRSGLPRQVEAIRAANAVALGAVQRDDGLAESRLVADKPTTRSGKLNTDPRPLESARHTDRSG